MLETLILAPLLINGKVVSQEIPYEDYLSNEQTQVLSISTPETDNCFVGHKFAVTEPVAARTKCYVSLDLKNFVESTGRTVYVERGIGLTPVTRQRYYYYADVDSEKITSVVTLDNDLETLVTILRSMEGDAVRFGISGVSNINNAILGYIRSINKHYSDRVEYYGVGVNSVFYGPQDDNFIEMCESDISHGFTYNNYFGSFIPSGLYNYWDHEWMDDDLTPVSELQFVDPLGSNENIDLIHMFCSLDGSYSNTGRNAIAIYLEGLNGTEKDMTSWLGDVLQACGHYFSLQDAINSFESINSFEQILSDNNSGCSYSDFLADMDAVNIAGSFLTGSQSVSDALYNYYHFEENSQNLRYYLFTRYASGNTQHNDHYLSDFSIRVYDYMGIDLSDGQFIETGTYYAARSAFDDRDPFQARNVSFEVRCKMASLLTEYVDGIYGIWEDS